MRIFALIASCVLGACGSPVETEDGSGGASPAEACDVWETELPDGSCSPPGPRTCGEGQVTDGRGGCAAPWPSTPCPDGMIAFPGDEACREVMPCGAGRWGNVPVEAEAVYVEQAAAAGGDGSEQQPYRTIGAAVSAVAAGGMVVVGEGTYSENVALDKPVRLWGRCPAMVAIVGSDPAPVHVPAAGTGSEVHGVALTGTYAGFRVDGATALLEGVWVHDTGDAGLRIQDQPGSGRANVIVKNVLVERPEWFGVFIGGSTVDMSDTVVRGTLLANRSFAQAIAVLPQPTSGDRSSLSLRRSALIGNTDVGLAVFASDALVEDVVVTDTFARPDGANGRGIVVQHANPGGAGALTMTRSIVERSVSVGVQLNGSSATITDSVVRSVRSGPLQGDGRGIDAESILPVGTTSDLTVLHTIVEDADGGGIVILGSTALIERSTVRDLAPRPDGNFGRGINVQHSFETGDLANATITLSLVEGALDTGIAVMSSTLTLTDSGVIGTLPKQGTEDFGDGIAVVSEVADASVSITGSKLDTNGRAGVSAFGGFITIIASSWECNPIDIATEVYNDAAGELADGGGNVCGCQGEARTCRSLSSSIVPPAPL